LIYDLYFTLRNIAINRKNCFDYVRLYGAFQVLISHGQAHLNLNIPSIIANIFSYDGVSIFFAISGFLVTISWINSNFNLKTYLIARSLRIFPALWTSAIISFFLIIFLGKFKFAFSLKGILWLFSQASPFTFWNPNELRDFGVGVINGSLWTIPVELQFYIFVPLLISLYFLLKRRFSGFISSLSLVFIAALSVLIKIYIPPVPAGDGTAAREGSIQGIKSFSVSLEKNKQSSNWKTVAYFLPKILLSIKKLKLNTNIFYNINFPNKKIKNIKGCKIVRPGKRKPGELSKIIKTNKNSFYFLVPSERKIHKSAKVNEDEYEMKKCFITITYHTNLNLTDKLISKKLVGALRKIIE